AQSPAAPPGAAPRRGPHPRHAASTAPRSVPAAAAAPDAPRGSPETTDGRRCAHGRTPRGRAPPAPPGAPPDTRPRLRRAIVPGAARASARAPPAPAPARAAGGRGARGPPDDTSRAPAVAPAPAAAPGGPAGPPWTGHSTAGLRARAPAACR